MLFDLYDLPFDVQGAHLLLGLALGLAFGIAAQISRFCLRRGLVAGPDRAPALGTWAAALATAIVATSAATWAGWIDLSDHRLQSADLPLLAVVVGGLAFGIGMVLTRGCISRMTVLGGTGNLRALSVFVIFALVAHATLKGVLAPLRVGLGRVTADIGIGSLAELPGGLLTWAALLVAGLIAAVVMLRPRPLHVAMAAVVGLLVTSGWVATGWLLLDEFDPMPVQSMAFTSPWADTLFWTIASTSIPAGFGVGMIGGVLGGAFASAAARRELQWVSFSDAPQTLRYIAGAALMGFGGVLAGGCTVGAGLSGVSMLSIAAIVALLSIGAGALIADRVAGRAPSLQPAE
ncbi:YeeE/YedE family protein [Pelagivirga sediminicola]|uniref:YeeE/YedE family protein n=1 Tax=Pelagivirga sediminicola TaxID=2170575 RepID=A0A2T7G8G2_9RHOB|nr:YeeE/YedE family protein [Pelagivirga sediminicola]PVA10712.1 YeeE/YedE family protein [Pelagivirga sediminicola]